MMAILVNYWNRLSDDYAPDLVPIEGTEMQIESSVYPQLTRMMEECRKAGGDFIINSAFRTRQEQKELFDRAVEWFITVKGWSFNKAKGTASWYVAEPGTSEHETGLAVDIVACQDKSEIKEFTEDWLKNNSCRYGFILRYPKGKEDTTGVMYEPWHFRYVGQDAAGEINRLGITLEEYLEQSKRNI